MDDFIDALAADVERRFEERALQALKQQHHHADNSPVSMHVLEESEMERRLQAREPLLQDVAMEAAKAGTSPVEEETPPERQEKKLMAGCTCGQTFVAVQNAGARVSVAPYDITRDRRDDTSTAIGSLGYSVSASPQQQDYSTS